MAVYACSAWNESRHTSSRASIGGHERSLMVMSRLPESRHLQIHGSAWVTSCLGEWKIGGLSILTLHYVQQVLQGSQNASRQPARQPRAAASQNIYSAARARTSQSPVRTPPPMYAPANSALEMVLYRQIRPLRVLLNCPLKKASRSSKPHMLRSGALGPLATTHLLVKLLWIQI
jgi:hypothetical protein